ncbi:MAG TPA: hypothetical protein ENJ53_01580 [Phaeodactylibacter sp.]|nr:hypothetical protein [Phaeodactylibacter sp.]
MNKSILSLAIALLLAPQFLISQDAMDVDDNMTASYSQEEDAFIDQMTPKGISSIAMLKSFELIDQGVSNMKIEASFIQKETFELKIYNTKGLAIYQESFETDELSLAMGFANLPADTYYVSLKTSDGEIVKTLQ